MPAANHADSFDSFLADGSINYSGIMPRLQTTTNASIQAEGDDNAEAALAATAEAQAANYPNNTNTLYTPFTSNLKNILNL